VTSEPSGLEKVIAALLQSVRQTQEAADQLTVALEHMRHVFAGAGHFDPPELSRCRQSLTAAKAKLDEIARKLEAPETGGDSLTPPYESYVAPGCAS
jgi:hypothetical protein